MSILERYQNPVVGSTVTLRLFTYNSNNRADVNSVSKVDIYYLDPAEVTETNPDGRTLVTTVTDVTHDDTGRYSVQVAIDDTFNIGKYVDSWTVIVDVTEPASTIDNHFQVYPNLWYTSPLPIVYDFNFSFIPNKIRQGSKRWLVVTITPNVPRGSDLVRYYENLAISSPLTISIEEACGDCVPADADSRLVVDQEPLELRERCKGFYFLDTCTLDCGIYNVWFQMEFGENLYISDKQQIQIY